MGAEKRIISSRKTIMAPQKKVAFETQNSYRVANDIKVVALLQKGPQTCVELAKGLGLTFTAITRIISELKRNNLVSLIPAKPGKSKKMGRRPSSIVLNTKLGLICAIDLSSADISIALATLDNAIVAETLIEEADRLDQGSLERIMAALEGLLAKPEFKKMPLLGICISTPGKLDEKGDFIFAHRFVDYTQIHLKATFANRFHVFVDVYHDVKLGLVGERAFGSIPKEDKNVFFAYIDREAGSSLLLNDHLYGGAHGLAGEVNDLAPVDDLAKDNWNGRFYTLEDIRRDIKEQLAFVPDHPLKSMPIFHTEDMVVLYEENDPLVSEALDKSARYNAIALLSVVNLLDVEDVVIQGRIVKFGEKYRALLEHYFSYYDLNHNTARILFSSLGGRANLLGAVYQGANLYWLRQFGELTAKRTRSRDYVVSEHFGDNL
jgi:predicted NBD/HSP70 family sugar kinase